MENDAGGLVGHFSVTVSHRNGYFLMRAQDHFRLVVAVEKAFGISFTSAEISRLANVGQFAELVSGKLGA